MASLDKPHKISYRSSNVIMSLSCNFSKLLSTISENKEVI